MMEFYHLFMLCLLPILTPLVGAVIGVYVGLAYYLGQLTKDME